MDIGGLSNGFCFIKQKKNCFGKRVIRRNTNDEFSHLAYACVRESVRSRDMGMMSHISFIACRISGLDLHVLLECVYYCVNMALHMHLGGE